MSRQSVAEQLEDAANRIADVSRADLQIMLRRAALMLRNSTGLALDPLTDDALTGIASEMRVGKGDLVQKLLREWLETNAYLPVRTVDEDSETDGNA